MDDERPVTAEPAREKMSAGAKAMLIVIPAALVLFAIDSVVLLVGDANDRAALAKHPVTEFAPPPAKPDGGALGLSARTVSSAVSSASAAAPAVSAVPASSAATRHTR